MRQVRRFSYWEVTGWTFAYTLSLFWLHRGLAFPFLLAGQDLHGLWIWKSGLVGCASDVWIAACLAVLQVAIVAGLNLFSRRLAFGVHWILWGLYAFWVVCHQNYVEFFHAPIIPYHLTYANDLNFIEANGRSILSWRSGLFIFFMAVWGWAWINRKKGRSEDRAFRIVVVGCFLAAIGLHVLHIRYRVQWFVPEPLQYNFFENLYVRSLHAVFPDPLTEEELSILVSNSGGAVDASDTETKNLEKILHFSVPNHKEQLTREGNLLVTEFESVRKRGDSPLLLVLLLESFRAMDVGRGASAAVSITPQFDALTKKGFWFPNVWSTGIVTRGGQEAAWCGFWGGQYTSSMREGSQVKNFPLTCIPDLIPNSFWWHGGEGNFDNQVTYWKRHGVHDFMDLHHFPESAPYTGWGISDHAFLQKTVQRLQLGKVGETRAGFLLSVTNHIPWEVPIDAPQIMSQVQFPGRHPSEKTVWYVDYAIGEWVRQMKAAKLWDSTLVILLGDHGILAPSFYQQEGSRSKSRYSQLGNVGFLLSGGIAERVATYADVQKVQTTVVSQMDVAPFIALLLGKTGDKFMGESLFQKKRRSIVMSHLMDEVYFPQYSVALPFRDCVKSGWAIKEKLPQAYCRGVLRYIHKMRVDGE